MSNLRIRPLGYSNTRYFMTSVLENCFFSANADSIARTIDRLNRTIQSPEPTDRLNRPTQLTDSIDRLKQ